ncbi:MAG TPA: hypothetical protein VEZ12_06305 [Herpetosiphonaceae bacterium]|jgi:hypothetical protein|nr:hypothetical protein [Herpetosiphonaceae bacterium]
MHDNQLPNEPRVMIDAQIEIRQGHTAPVLAQPSTGRLIVLNSTLLAQVEVGQTVMLHLPEQEPHQILVEAIDRSSLIMRYATPTA